MNENIEERKEEFADFMQNNYGGNKEKVLKILEEKEVGYIMTHAEEVGCSKDDSEFLRQSHKAFEIGEMIRRLEQIG